MLSNQETSLRSHQFKTDSVIKEDAIMLNSINLYANLK